MARKTHKQRVDEQVEQYKKQLGEPLTGKQLAEQAEARAVALQKEALIAEIRRQRTVGKALDLQAALEAARGGALALPAAIAQGDLSKVAMAQWLQNVMVLTDRGQNADDLALQIEAADKGATQAFKMLELLAANQRASGRGGYIDAPVAQDGGTGLTREEKIALVRRQIALEAVK
jgi:hypothetical protein